MSDTPTGNSNGCGCLVFLIIVGGIICFASQSPEGKLAFRQAVAVVQPPVQVTLSPFLIFDGYYVEVKNTSTSSALANVTVTYRDANGNTKSQSVGPLKPGETKTLDPSVVNWTVAKHETISVSTNGNYVPKVLETNALIH
jgi:hypothetical protein